MWLVWVCVYRDICLYKAILDFCTRYLCASIQGNVCKLIFCTMRGNILAHLTFHWKNTSSEHIEYIEYIAHLWIIYYKQQLTSKLTFDHSTDRGQYLLSLKPFGTFHTGWSLRASQARGPIHSPGAWGSRYTWGTLNSTRHNTVKYIVTCSCQLYDMHDGCSEQSACLLNLSFVFLNLSWIYI